MARYTGPSCKLCRREGTKLLLKGQKCLTEKCPLETRNFAPGMHGRFARRRRRASEYAVQLREKQKIKRTYGVLENQFRNYFLKSIRRRGMTGDNLMIMLETRLDNVIYRMGFCPSRKSARQMIHHQFFAVNGRTVDVPSYSVRVGDRISIREKGRETVPIMASIEVSQREETPSWLRVDFKELNGEVLSIPTRGEIPEPVQEQLVVELFSR
ncbi:MAG: 30S ribosomal protein S4 [Candidatus Glassbacteria bacterium RBG_16_58_8]|uniref:Small ribosomal subunit protein uS4 n=1 Tax=Candidatus Glassbacteria bacterium RBG_16_58_8 TaxID=1817866 RepID=A0A1F5YCJ7_9BACT|nr:MAG: 30S ribosomal protein S4 [Candidatus Glassbacteria bacterium RBG_16_58_8]